MNKNITRVALVEIVSETVHQYIGPYETEHDALKRITCLSTDETGLYPDAKFTVVEVSVERLNDGRFILNGTRVVDSLETIKTDQNGFVSDSNLEFFASPDYFD